MNHKRVYRPCLREGLSLLERRPNRHHSAAHTPNRMPSTSVYECWRMDFVANQLFDGWRLRAPTLVDIYTRDCLTIEVPAGLRGVDVVPVTNAVTMLRGALKSVHIHKGPDFISRIQDQSAYPNGVAIVFSIPGKPPESAYISSFNGRLRHEHLNTHWFISPEEAHRKIEAYRNAYNETCLHSALVWQLPAVLAWRCRLAPAAPSKSEPEVSTIDRS